MGKLVLVRHGESQWNLENRFTGWVDIPLSPKGIIEAQNVGKKLQGYVFNKAFTSALTRAQETLRLILEQIDQREIPIEQDKSLNERHYGALQGKNKAETAALYGEDQVKIWRRSFDIAPPKDVTELNPEGISESLKNTAERTLPYFLEKILPLVKKGESILVAAHGNSLRSIVMYIDKLNEHEVIQLEIATGQAIVYEYQGDQVTSKKIL